ncbi:MAG: tRNA (N(6)-L-threonylcarbamoyladenosine(37)-C(2))-methylthiotransferase MtaB [Terriglobales bacterium]
MTSFYVKNFGCRAAQADGAAIERQFRQFGLESADSANLAEIVVLNTCTVTASADQDARATIRKIHRENPGCQMVVTGCYAQRAPEEIANLPAVTKIVGNSHKHRLAEIVLAAGPSHSNINSLVSISDLRTSENRLFVSDIFAHTELLAAPVFDAANERTRPNLKVQDGCNNRCSFCVIPHVRGQSRSLHLEEILREVNALVCSGYREVVVSGINLGRWGRDLPKDKDEESRAFRFEDLVRAIVDQTSLEKLRISSVEPMDWSDELISLMAGSPRIAKHAHVPMQSGSDRVLRLMHRKYRPWHYREKIGKIRAAMPNAAIGADVMVGFPGESGADFAETHRMIAELAFTYLHVFTYSARPGTPAASMSNQVPVHVARERNRILRELAEKKKLEFMHSFIGEQIEAITLNQTHHERGRDFTEALTTNFLKLRLAGLHPANHWMQVEVNNVEAGSLFGVVA